MRLPGDHSMSISRRRLLAGSSGAMLGAKLGWPGLSAAQDDEDDDDKVLFGELKIMGVDSGPANPTVNARVNAFMRLHPQVNLTFQNTLDPPTLLSLAGTKECPDVIWYDRFDTAYWAANGILLPLFGYISRTNFHTDIFYEGAATEVEFDDNVFALPDRSDTKLLYVNLDHLAELGIDGTSVDTSSWEQLADLSSQLAQKQGNAVTRIGLDPGISRGGIWEWARANGSDLLTGDGKDVDFVADEVTNALEYCASIILDQGGLPALEALAPGGTAAQAFIDGKISMMLGEYGVLTDSIATRAPDLNFATLPLLERGGAQNADLVGISSGSAWALTPIPSENRAALAWAFVSFMASDLGWVEAAKLLSDQQAEETPYLPVLSGSVPGDKLQSTFMDRDPASPIAAAVKSFQDVARKSHPRSSTRFIGSRQIEQVLQEVGVMPAVRGQSSAKAGLEAANQQARQVVAAY